MKNSKRYNASASEDYQLGSNHQVLKNYLNITSQVTMEKLETAELERAELAAFSRFDLNYQFSVKDVCQLHKSWLGDIYPFAGKFRSVNLSKDGFPFAGANYIPKCMQQFERDYLSKYTPCHFRDTDALAHALGIVHVEFILIHPFREGNGRIARLLAVLMALQAQQPPLDFSVIDQTNNPLEFKNYIEAIHRGQARDYKPMEMIFKKILETKEKISA